MAIRLREVLDRTASPYGHSTIVRDLLAIAKANDRSVMTSIITMLQDLKEYGHTSKYLKKLKGLPIFELKPRSRGGPTGGARVYCAFMPSGDAVLLCAEVKPNLDSAPKGIERAVRLLKRFIQSEAGKDRRK